MRTEKPAYLLLYESLRREILAGDRPFGSRLPSRRSLAADRGVSPVTVDHSYELLCEEGYAEARPKSGYYVLYRAADGFSSVPPSLPENAPVTPAPAPSRSVFPFSVLARTMRRVLSEQAEAILVKPPNTGCEALRQALSRYLSRSRGIHVSPDQIVIGPGAEYLYGLVVELLGARRVYGVESPSYAKIEQVYRARGVDLEFLPLGRDGIRSDALRTTRASVLHVTPFRSFPSGVTASVSRRQEYLRWAAGEDRYLVEDDYESEFSLLRKPVDTLFSAAEKPGVIYLNTFSRTVSPAFRVGYMVLPRPLLPVFTVKAGFYSCAVPAFEQYVLAELLNSGDLERHINRVRRLERKGAVPAREHFDP